MLSRRFSWLPHIIVVGVLGIVGVLMLSSDMLPWVQTQPLTRRIEWGRIPSPDLGEVAAISAADAWAVGLDYSNFPSVQTLIKHWDGTEWEIISNPRPGSSSFPFAMATVSSNDVWVVGDYCPSSGDCLSRGGDGPGQTFVLHWDGKEWSQVPSPSPGSYQNYLKGVVAVSVNDVWAVGDHYHLGEQTIILHWNGKVWVQVPSPSPGSVENRLDGVAAISANDVWAVGTYDRDGSDNTLILHWDGKEWSQEANSNTEVDHGVLYQVAAISANDVWAVGKYSTADAVHTLTIHWNGRDWRIVPSPSPGVFSDSLTGVVGISANDVWAVGDYSSSDGHEQTLVMHWDGTLWRIVPGPSPGLQPASFVEAQILLSYWNPSKP